MTELPGPALAAPPRGAVEAWVAQLRAAAGLLRLVIQPASPLRQAADQLVEASREAAAAFSNPQLPAEDRERLLAAARRAHQALGTLEILAAVPGAAGMVGRTLARLRGPLGEWLGSLDDGELNRPRAPADAGAPE